MVERLVPLGIRPEGGTEKNTVEALRKAVVFFVARLGVCIGGSKCKSGQFASQI